MLDKIDLSLLEKVKRSGDKTIKAKFKGSKIEFHQVPRNFKVEIHTVVNNILWDQAEITPALIKKWCELSEMSWNKKDSEFLSRRDGAKAIMNELVLK